MGPQPGGDHIIGSLALDPLFDGVTGEQVALTQERMIFLEVVRRFPIDSGKGV